VPLTFDLSTPKPCHLSQGHSLYHVWTFWDHSFLSYAPDNQTNKQTDKQTDGGEHFTHADRPDEHNKFEKNSLRVHKRSSVGTNSLWSTVRSSWGSIEGNHQSSEKLKSFKKAWNKTIRVQYADTTTTVKENIEYAWCIGNRETRTPLHESWLSRAVVGVSNNSNNNNYYQYNYY